MPEAGPSSDCFEIHRCCWGDGAMTASISRDAFLSKNAEVLHLLALV